MFNGHRTFCIRIAILVAILSSGITAFPFATSYALSTVANVLAEMAIRPGDKQIQPNQKQIQTNRLSNGVSSTQNFDTLQFPTIGAGTALGVPPGWAFSETGDAADGLYVADTGFLTAGNTYNYGLALDRAFGQRRSADLISTIGSSFTNNTGATIASIDISYTGEQWLLGLGDDLDRMDFQYSLDATSLATGTWVDVDPLDFTSPITTGLPGPKDGNNAANRTSLSDTIADLNIPNGATFWIRWVDLDIAGGEDGLAIDDFSLTVTAPEMSVENSNNEVIVDGDDTPTAAKETDFGSTTVAVGTVVRTFTIKNSGTANLNLDGLQISGDHFEDFSITAEPSSPIAPAGSTNFEVTFDPSASGLRSAMISIANDDADENPYDFAIQGTGSLPATPTPTPTPITLVVDNTGDDEGMVACTSAPNDCNLRGATIAATDGNVIVFDPIIFGSSLSPEGMVTIDLLTGGLGIVNDITIQGPGAGSLAITNNGFSPVVVIALNATVTISGVTIFGGDRGVHNLQSNLTLSGVVVRNNDTSSGPGGGIYNEGGTLSIIESTVRNNATQSPDGGGGIANRAGTLNVIRSTISGNSAGGGGGIYTETSLSPATVNVTNSTISGNSATVGGGISTGGTGISTINIKNSTVSFNSTNSGGGGGGIFNDGIVTLNSTIVSNNTGPVGPDILNSSIFSVHPGVLSGSYNLVKTTADYTFSSGSNNIVGFDPQLGPLANNGGPTFTHMPAAGSPGHDKGCAFGAVSDQRGYQRTVDWPGITNGTCTGSESLGVVGIGPDIGAVELLAPTAANAMISGRVLGANGRGLANVYVSAIDMNGDLVKFGRTNSFGYFTIFEVPAGADYIIEVSSKRHSFPKSSMLISVVNNVEGVIFVADP